MSDQPYLRKAERALLHELLIKYYKETKEWADAREVNNELVMLGLAQIREEGRPVYPEGRLAAVLRLMEKLE